MPTDHEDDEPVTGDVAAQSADTGRDTFRPATVSDRTRRRRRTDHAPNEALANALEASHDSDVVNVDLMASHAPGEKPFDPRYHVRVSITNEGMGDAGVGDTALAELIDRDDVTVDDVWSTSTFRDGFDPWGDDAEADDIVRALSDRLVLHVRPVETRVEPIEVPASDVPGRFTDVDDVFDTAARVLDTAAEDPTVVNVKDVARSLATVVYMVDPEHFAVDVDEPEAAPQVAHDELWARADADEDDFEATYNVTDVAGEAWGHDPIEDEHEAVEVAAAIVAEHAPDYHPVDVLKTVAPPEWDVDATGGFTGFDMRRYDVEVFNRPYGRFRGEVDFKRRDFDALVAELEDKASQMDSAAAAYGEDRGEPYRRCASDIRVALDNHAPGTVDGVGPKPAATKATVYVCHGCERSCLPGDFRAIDGEEACPRCGTRVDWDKTPSNPRGEQ